MKAAFIVQSVLSLTLILSCSNNNREVTSASDNAGVSADSIKKQAVYRQTNNLSSTLNRVAQMQNICCGSPIPPGWIKINDGWDPTSCGNPSTIVYNVCTIERYDDKPIGSLMNVCAGAPTPAGWVVVNTYWDPTSCGHPSSIVQNMKQIKRLS